jgi:hypothetical protein
MDADENLVVAHAGVKVWHFPHGHNSPIGDYSSGQRHLNLTVIDTLANDIIEACQFLAKHGGTATAPQLHGHDRSAPKC